MPKSDRWRSRDNRGEHVPNRGLRITPDRSRPGTFILWDGDRRIMDGTQEEIRAERDRLRNPSEPI